MKKILTTAIILCSLLGSGCNKWLDVKPQGETTQDELFKTQRGFRDALTGAYIRMKSGNIYGSALTWGNIEYMAINWENPSPTFQPLTKLINGDYTDVSVKGWMDDTYQDLYKVIADANSILARIDAQQSVFTEGNYAIIKGEALTLRAFCHFDAMRLYGPLPSAPGALRILPYVTTVSKNIHEPLIYQDFMKSVINDLDQAESLLKDVDPIRKYSIAQLNPGLNDQPVVSDDYLRYRQLRMNYYAVLALKARIYLWLTAFDASYKANAAKYAHMVIDATDPTGVPLFRLGEERDRAAEDYTMSSEHIFALSIYNLASTANNLFSETGNFVRNEPFTPFTVQFPNLNNLFPVAERTSDIRWKEMWTYKTTQGKTNFVMYKKYIQRSVQPILQVPLLRLSEMYLILTECEDDKGQAETAYSFFCSKKGIPFSSFNAADWITDRKNKLIREYVREFYAEGQSFFTYKRFNVIALPAKWTYTFYSGTINRYVVPKPDREINYINN